MEMFTTKELPSFKMEVVSCTGIPDLVCHFPAFFSLGPNHTTGPNAFEVVDDVTSVVNAQRTDLTMTAEIFPTLIPTFNAVVLEWLHLEDTDEIGRQWTSQAYYNCYGFGDAAVCVVFLLPFSPSPSLLPHLLPSSPSLLFLHRLKSFTILWI
jgi:hypothetical protein